MVVPAIRIVVQNHHGGAFPFFLLLQEVDDFDQEMLFIDGVRVTGVAILISGRLYEIDGREVAGFDRGEKVVGVIFVVGGTVISDFSD